MNRDLFEMVADRRLTAEEVVDIMAFERELSTPKWLRLLKWFFRLLRDIF